MPSQYMQRFGASPATHVWLWNNDPSEDLAACTFLDVEAGGLHGDFVVDRTGPNPAIRWQLYDMTYDSNINDYIYVPTGNYDSLEPNVGDHINPSGSPVPWEGMLKPLVQDMTGWWVSDEYGRPYNLNDLLA